MNHGQISDQVGQKSDQVGQKSGYIPRSTNCPYCLVKFPIMASMVVIIIRLDDSNQSFMA